MKSIFKKKEKTAEELMNDELIALMRKEIETLGDKDTDDAAKSAATLRLHRFAEDLEKFKAEKLEKSKKNDIAFKRIFGSKGNEEILKDFLEYVLERKIKNILTKFFEYN